ncbi:MAG: hypothetical protein RIC36_14705 [Rhodospirillales bacterium]
MQIISVLLASLILASCVSLEEVNRAFFAVDAEWQRDYDKVVDDYGTRYYPVPKDVAVELLIDSLQDMGMIIQSRGLTDGIVLAESLAPDPLSKDEWKAVAEIEEPRMKRIVAEEIGTASAAFFVLDPTRYRITLGAKVTGGKNASLIAIQGRLVHVGGIQGMYAPKHIPPLAAQLGALKIWDHFRQKLEDAGYETKPIKKPENFST